MAADITNDRALGAEQLGINPDRPDSFAFAILQVILFTHHRHVVDLAEARLKDRVDVIQL
jgi:hypothetical protein